MHNCKSSKNCFIDLALGEIEPARATELQAELNDCPDCHEEYESLRSTLHVSTQALRSAVPGEEYWPGYRTRLHSKLLASPAPPGASPALASISLRSQMWLALKAMATTSVRIPVPAALALLLVFGVSYFVLRARAQVNLTPLTPVALFGTEVKTETREVPVIHERVVTRVVYVEKKARRSASDANRSNRTEIPATPNSVAVTGANPATALSLAGFKPTNEVKLTVIKGSYKDEKR
jgi:anti-sigma factor RsiW